ncbi:MAG: hypothetical protein F6K08_35365 [Okeania sp. SIO1H6]|nr:hypothetical protein [Okeania sp. SIO1H6]
MLNKKRKIEAIVYNKLDKYLLQITRLFIRSQESGVRSHMGMALISVFRLEILFFVKGISPVKNEWPFVPTYYS